MYISGNHIFTDNSKTNYVFFFGKRELLLVVLEESYLIETDYNWCE